jgi:hypothetical protein
MKTLLSVSLKILFAMLIIIQRDVDGGSLIRIDAHIGLGIVVIGLVLWAILEVALFTEVELETNESEPEEDIGLTIHEGPYRNDYRSSKLERLKPLLQEEEGSFNSLLKRHR